MAVPILIGSTTLIFIAMTASAGNYVPGMDLNSNMRPEDIQRLRASLGLDQPLYIQYAHWIIGIAHGDFGRSMIDGTAVSTHILERLPNTLELSLAALLIAVVLAIPLGVAGGIMRGSLFDRLLTAISVAGFAMPQFWLGLLMILLLSVSFHTWGLPSLPSGGAYDPVFGGGILDRLTHLAMPAAVLSTLYIATWSRYVRGSIIEVLSADYIRTARSKGMSERRVVYVHALRNALMPLATLVGLEFPRLFSGTLVVEVVFAWPGIGLFSYQRALQADYTSVLGVSAFVAILVVAGNIVADLSYGLIDPRIRAR